MTARQWLTVAIGAALVLLPGQLFSQGTPIPEYQAPSIGPKLPSIPLIEARGPQCHAALVAFFNHGAINIIRIAPGAITLHLRFDHDMRDMAHVATHVIQFYEAVKQSGFVTQYEDAHGQGKESNIMERQAVKASDAFQRGLKAERRQVCDGESV